MLEVALRETMQQMHASVKAINAASSGRGDGWRQEVVRVRRVVAEQMRRMSSLIAGAPGPASPNLNAFRGALSHLRSSVAELQAAWPAVSLDPDAPSYLHSVQLVREGVAALEESLVALEHEASRTRSSGTT